MSFSSPCAARTIPSADSLAPLSVLGTEIAKLAVKPAYLADTSAEGLGSVVYHSPATGYLSIYRKSLGGGKARAILTGGTLGAARVVPSVRLADGCLPARLSAVHGPLRRSDAVIVWDLERNRMAGRYQFVALVSMLSPRWLPGGEDIVVSGLSESGISDLYRIRLPDGALEPLTSDRFQDLDPSPSPDGRKIVFASDRTAGGMEGAANLFVLDLETSKITQLTSGRWRDESPVWADSGRIVFSSDRDGVLNVFSVDTLGAGRRETSAWTGAFDAIPLPGDGGLVVGGFHDLSWNLYRYPPDSAARADTFVLATVSEPPPPAGQWSWEVPADSVVDLAAVHEPYRKRLTRGLCRRRCGDRPRVRRRTGHFFPDERSAGR